MTDDELVERLARALREEEMRSLRGTGWESVSEPHREFWRDKARRFLLPVARAAQAGAAREAELVALVAACEWTEGGDPLRRGHPWLEARLRALRDGAEVQR